MVSSLRNRFALIVLLGAMLVPALAGNLRGLTHVLVCEESVERPFVVEILDNGEAVVGSAQTIESDEERVCGGLLVDLRAHLDGDRLDIEVVLSNETSIPWAGTVGLAVATPEVDVVVPASTGTVEPGESSAVRLTLQLSEGVTDIDGTLLLGP